MTATEERAALVALLRMGDRPWVEYADLVEELGSAAAVLERELTSRREPGGQTSLLPEDDAPDPDELIAKATAEVERWDAQRMRLLTVLDRDFPPNLRAVHDRPPILFVAGEITQQDARAVAVVGTRQATDAGIAASKKIAEHLVEAGYTVVSGLAAGIDTAAHTAALDHDGRTVAVIGTGLTHCYPPQNEALQRRIASQCAVLSQFWPDAPPTRRSFPMRNAVISGIALATIIVEAPETSGARMLARLALAQGRPVFLLEALVERQSWARQAATRPGTHVAHDPSEITRTLERLISPGPLMV